MQRHFYATSDDLLEVFDRFEKGREVIYTPMGGVESPNLTVFHSGKFIPTLSSPAKARYDHSYLVTPKEVRAAVRQIALRTGVWLMWSTSSSTQSVWNSAREDSTLPTCCSMVASPRARTTQTLSDFIGVRLIHSEGLFTCAGVLCWSAGLGFAQERLPPDNWCAFTTRYDWFMSHHRTPPNRRSALDARTALCLNIERQQAGRQ